MPAPRRVGLLFAISLVAALALPAGVGAHSGNVQGGHEDHARNLICSGGDFATFTPALIPSGTYRTITVTGFCEVASGATIRVLDGVTVAPGGFLVAAGALDNGMQSPDCNRTIRVSDGIRVGAGGSLILGDGPGSGCTTNTKTRIDGGLRADRPLYLIVHGVSLDGGINSHGGGDNLPCNFAGLPTYLAVEDSHIDGRVSVSGYRACWLGFARNHIDGSVTLANNVLDDPDAMEILSNTIHGRLACWGNSPTPTNIADGVSFEPNTVSGKETGQCVGL